ncbi:unnamed protein product [marine sediment metagenome]|uniref:MoaD/ThiS family protein n=1 Tax=marine sediment metagenome TaxID=412755 RepID=X0UPG1_9ZZZZ
MEINLYDSATVSDALNELNKRFSATFKEKTGRKLEEALESLFNLFLNGTYLNLPSDLERKLKEKDEIIILRPVSGG